MSRVQLVTAALLILAFSPMQGHADRIPPPQSTIGLRAPAGASKWIPELRLRLLKISRTMALATDCSRVPEEWGWNPQLVKTWEMRVGELSVADAIYVRSIASETADAIMRAMWSDPVGTCNTLTREDVKDAADAITGRTSLWSDHAQTRPLYSAAASTWLNQAAPHVEKLGRDTFVFSRCSPDDSQVAVTGVLLLDEFFQAEKKLSIPDQRFAGDLFTQGMDRGEREMAQNRSATCASITRAIQKRLQDLSKGVGSFWQSW